MSRAGTAFYQHDDRARRRTGSLRERLSLGVVAIYLRDCDRFGPGCRLRGRPFVENDGRIEIGDCFFLNSIPARSHLVTGCRGHLKIGDGVSIGFGAAIASHARIEIGDSARIGNYAVIMDTDFHDIVDRDLLPDGRAIIIGDGVLVGSGVTILKGSVIGPGARILAGSVVTGSIPARATASGVPARVVGPAGTLPSSDDEAACRNAHGVQELCTSTTRVPDPSNTAGDRSGG